MSRPGRKRKMAQRFPSGELRKPTTLAQLQQMQITRDEAQKVVVLSQPHRRGDTSQLRACPLGSFILDNCDKEARQTFYDAAQEYASIVRRWRAARGIPTTVRVGEGGMLGQGPSETTVRAWWDQIRTVENRLVYSGSANLLNTMRRLVIDEVEVRAAPDAIKRGLWIIAAALDRIDAKQHPFA
jgi:hypothetical protein